MAAIALAATLVGCGGSEEGAEESGSEPVQVAALGDSITAGSPLWDPDPEVRAQIGSELDERSQYELWAELAAERRDSELKVRNCGVFGERTDEIALRLADCAEGAEALIVQGGINDIAQGRDPARAASELDAIVIAAQRMDLEVALANVLPWNNGHPAADAPIAALNRAIERIGRERGVRVLDFHSTLEDRKEPGTMRDRYSDDGDHPSILGYRELGRLVSDALRRPDLRPRR